MNLRVGSVSTGIGGDAVAWHPLGWESVFFSEIGAFPSAVLAERYPDVPNLGNFTAADFCERARACGPIDVLAGGTPCQAFSVAGKRGSLDDARGNLTLRFVEIAHELDTAIVVWENVPGVLSAEDNAFGCFLGGMVGAETALIPCDDCGSHYAKRYWRTRVQEGNPTESWRYPVWPDYGMVAGPKRSLAWRILDAQHFGLAQRRRRVCVVSFRAGDGINPGAVLFEPESLRRYSAPSREAGQGVAGTLAAGAHPSGFNGQDAAKGNIVAHALRGRANASHREDSDNYVAHTLRADGFDASEDGTGRGTPIVPVGFNSRQDPAVTGDVAGSIDCARPQAQAVAFQQHGSDVGKMGALRAGHGDVQSGVPFTVFSHNSCAKKRHAKETDVASPVDSCGGHSPGQGGTVVAFDTTQITHPENRCNPKPGDPCHPLASGAHAPALAQDLRVRRLMPTECEALQGFSRNWTRIAWKGKSDAECPDGHRYKGLGNAWATHVFRWIGRRIELVLGALPKPPRWLPKPKR